MDSYELDHSLAALPWKALFPFHCCLEAGGQEMVAEEELLFGGFSLSLSLPFTS